MQKWATGQREICQKSEQLTAFQDEQERCLNKAPSLQTTLGHGTLGYVFQGCVACRAHAGYPKHNVGGMAMLQTCSSSEECVTGPTTAAGTLQVCDSLLERSNYPSCMHEPSRLLTHSKLPWLRCIVHAKHATMQHPDGSI
jgi:hypothetical protein